MPGIMCSAQRPEEIKRRRRLFQGTSPRNTSQPPSRTKLNSDFFWGFLIIKRHDVQDFVSFIFNYFVYFYNIQSRV